MKVLLGKLGMSGFSEILESSDLSICVLGGLVRACSLAPDPSFRTSLPQLIPQLGNAQLL